VGRLLLLLLFSSFSFFFFSFFYSFFFFFFFSFSFSSFFFFIAYRLFFQRLRRGSFDETFLPSFLRSASVTHSLWATVSSDLCQTVILQSSHMGVPFSSSSLVPFIYILNST
jgi:hypothetical protein